MAESSRQAPEWGSQILADGEAMMAGFIAWLATQGVPDARRHRTHEEIDHFLRWCNAQPQATSDPATAARNYLSHVRGADVGEHLTLFPYTTSPI